MQMTQAAINLRNKWAKEDKAFWDKLDKKEVQILNSLAQALS